MNEQSLAQSPVVIDLADPAARDSRVAGAKAASLAWAHDGGLPTLPGMVLTTVGASTLFATVAPPSDVTAALHRRWRALSGDGRRPVVVRSSSTIEDAATSSMAGRFTSVLDVKGWPQFLTAVRTVLDSATNPQLADAPMAVLVQPFLAAARGGVLFGADPVTGNAEHLVVAAVNGGPDALVAGQVDGATTTLDRAVVSWPVRRSSAASGGAWPPSPLAATRSSPVLRTWSGRSTTTAGCGSSRAGPSPPRYGSRPAPGSGRAQWRRRSPTPWRRWRLTCGSAPCGAASLTP
ncbi:MAG: hypothetical protein M3179_02505 [Actinomycetota bacterium]|nr:hypothetical protein [Actinomycetota bacterium]